MKILILLFFLSLNIIAQNNDFENWTNNEPDNWIYESGLALSQESSIVFSGSSSAEISVNSGNQNNNDFYCNFSVTQGETYNLKFYIYHTEGNVYARFTLNGSRESTSNNAITNQWQTLSQNYTANVTETITVGLVFFDDTGFDGSEIVYVDNFTVIEESLPVELTSFTASVLENNVKLNWETATEVNNYGFDVERASTSSAPDKSWEKIGFVQGHGNSNSPKSYSFIDQSILSTGKYFYRLKQIDIDGQFEYSNFAEVNFETPAEFSLLQNYPNPFNPTTTISFKIPMESKTKLSVYNILGEEIKILFNRNLTAGSYNVNFDASELKSGIYFYTLSTSNFSQTKRMILLK